MSPSKQDIKKNRSSSKIEDTISKSVGATNVSKNSSTRLNFPKSLIPNTKTQAPIELTKRLKELHENLASLSQEGFEADSLVSPAKELLSPQLMGSKDEGVKVFTGCCLADILRLSAPNAPYSLEEQEKIFTLFLDLLIKLGSDKKGYAQYYSYILVSLATVKSAILITDFESDQLLCKYFVSIFKLAEEKITREQTLRLVEVLEQLAQEAKTIPAPIIELILKQFSKKRQLECPPAFAMAKSLCNSVTDRLQAPLCQYFSELLTSYEKEADEEENTGFKLDVDEVHSLFQLIYPIEPNVLLSVIPQLEAELTITNHDLRQLATTTLGAMLVHPSSTLTTLYPTVWKSWLQRRHDKNPHIRTIWIQQCPAFYNEQSSLLNDINSALEDKFMDTDEKVRAAACRAFEPLKYTTLKQYVPLSLIKALAGRVRDKKSFVRKEATIQLGEIYDQAYEDISLDDTIAVEKFGWIPSFLLNAVYTNEHDLILGVEQAFRTSIIGQSTDAEEYTERFLRITSALDSSSYKIISVLLRRQQSMHKDFSVFLTTSRKLSGEIANYSENNEQLFPQVRLLASRLTSKFPEPSKAAELLARYPRSSDRKLNEFFDKLLDPTVSLANARRAEAEAIKRIDQVAPALNDVFRALLIKIGPSFVYRDMLPILLKYANSYVATKSRKIKSSENSLLSETADRFLKELTSIYPTMYEDHVQDLINMLLIGGPRSEEWLSALSNFAQSSPKPAQENGPLAKKLANFVLEGTTGQSLHAAIALGCFDPTRNKVKSCIKTIVNGLNVDSPRLPSRLEALSEFISRHIELTEEYMETVIKFIISDLLPKNISLESTETEAFQRINLPSILQAKMSALSILVNRSVVFAGHETKQRLVKPVFSLLWTILEKKGETAENGNTHDVLRSHLRLEAACAILNLAGCESYALMITPAQFNCLAGIIQDEYFHVRETFGQTLIKKLCQCVLPTKYATILFLAAFEVEDSFKNQIKQVVKQLLAVEKIGERSVHLIECNISRLIHLLAHDSDFTQTSDDLKLFSKYIEFFLSLLATHDNISFLYAMVGQIKLTEDAAIPARTENLYILSDLAQYVINNKRHVHSWNITPFSDTIQLPKDLFRPLPNHPESNDIAKKSYLPPEFLNESAQVMLPPSQLRAKIDKNTTSSRSAPTTPAADSDGEGIKKEYTLKSKSRKRSDKSPREDQPRRKHPRKAREHSKKNILNSESDVESDGSSFKGDQ